MHVPAPDAEQIRANIGIKIPPPSHENRHFGILVIVHSAMLHNVNMYYCVQLSMSINCYIAMSKDDPG